MAGIYIHIPFCKQACHYCNFHFSTSLRRKNELIAALLKEIGLQQGYLEGDPVETIYFGGGTPSLCSRAELKTILQTLEQHFAVIKNPEITLETNPDDISPSTLLGWQDTGINRLSIGIQSFFDEDLKWMNRAHTAYQARKALEDATRYFSNITADLIYGTPFLTDDRWEQNIAQMTALDIPHLSCYALTVEPQTMLQKFINKSKSPDIDPDQQARQFLFLMDYLERKGYEHYEISNFSKPGFRSRHNSSYWQGKHYLGIGPSAHSFNGSGRQWNVSNNAIYIRTLSEGKIPFEREILTPVQKHNEYIMTSLRTVEGLDLAHFEKTGQEIIRRKTRKYLEHGLLTEETGFIRLTKKGRLMADGIASDLFFD